MLDEIRNDEPSTHQWLLHARAPMIIDANSGLVDVLYPDCGLRVKLLTPEPENLTVRQTDRSEPPPNVSTPAWPAEWHTVIESRTAAQHRDFLSVLLPWKHRAPQSTPQRLATISGHALTVDLDTILVSDEAGRRTVTEFYELTGRAAYQCPGRVVLFEAEFLRTRDLELRADLPITVDIITTDSQWDFEVQPCPTVVLTLTVPKNVRRISGTQGLRHQVSKEGGVISITLPASKQLINLKIDWQRNWTS
jgi:hypothetical protein